MTGMFTMHHTDQNGFTIVELLIAIVVGSIIMTAIYAMINLGQGTAGSVSRRITTQQDTRAVIDLMAMEISMASYNPNMTLLTWNGNMLSSCKIDGTSNTTATMVQARKGIQLANANQIGVAMDLNNSTTMCDVANEYIVYKYNSTQNNLTRNTNGGGDQVILGVNTSVDPTAVVRVRNSETSPVTSLFRYFNSAGTELVPPLTDAQIGQIRRIRISIVGDDQVQDSKSGLYKVSRRTYSTDVLVRNHAMSP